MREHHTLGTARGTRGINNRGKVIAATRNVLRFAAMRGQPMIDVQQTWIIGRVSECLYREYAHHAAELATHVVKGFPLHVGAKQQHLAARIVDDIGHVFGPVLRVQRHHHQTQTQRRLIENHPFGRVAQHHRHTVARLQTIFFQRGLPACNLMIDLRPGVVAPIRMLRVVISVRHRVRRAFYPFAQQAVERACVFDCNHVLHHVRHGEPPLKESRVFWFYSRK